MKVVWEKDSWWWEDLGIYRNADGVKWGYWGYIGQARPLPSWLQWLPEFRLRYPDKIAHGVAAFGLTLLLSRWFPLQVSVAGAWVVMAGYEFLPLLSGRIAYVSVKDLIANTVGCGLAFALVHRGV